MIPVFPRGPLRTTETGICGCLCGCKIHMGKDWTMFRNLAVCQSCFEQLTEPWELLG